MKVDVTTKKYDMWPHHTEGTHVLYVKTSRLATKVNKILESYPSDVRFRADDEVTFRVPQSSLDLILKTVGYKKVRG